jgi:hypothetical protein
MLRLAKTIGSMHSLVTQRVTHFVGIWSVYNHQRREGVTNKVWDRVWDRTCAHKWEIDSDKTRQD